MCQVLDPENTAMNMTHAEVTSENRAAHPNALDLHVKSRRVTQGWPVITRHPPYRVMVQARPVRTCPWCYYRPNQKFYFFSVIVTWTDDKLEMSITMHHAA